MESTHFEAHRIESNVANADEPDGKGDGTISYNDQKGLTGEQDLVFTTETWNGNTQNYVEQGDLPSISCPGDTTRCIASIDISTKQSGWGMRSEDSFKIEVN